MCPWENLKDPHTPVLILLQEEFDREDEAEVQRILSILLALMEEPSLYSIAATIHRLPPSWTVLDLGISTLEGIPIRPISAYIYTKKL